MGRNMYDSSPMRRVSAYTSPERSYNSNRAPLVRRASTELLYQPSRSFYPQPNNRGDEFQPRRWSDEFQPRRWSDDYSYGRSQPISSSDKTSSTNRKYGDGRQSPRSYYNNYYNKSYPSGSYQQQGDRSSDYSQGYDSYGDRYQSNYDYYNRGYGKYDRRSEYSDSYYSEKTARRNDHPNVRRYLLAKDPKDKRISGNGLGMKVVGGKEIRGTNGRLGAYIAKIIPGGVVSTLGELKEGNLVVEWNGRNLLDKTYEEVQKIISQTAEEMEIEIAVRNDVDMLSDKSVPDTFFLDEKPMPVNEDSRKHDYYYGPSQSSSKTNYGYRNDSYSSNREDGLKRPPLDPIDVNGNGPDMWRSHSPSKTEDDYRYRDSQRPKNSYSSSNKGYPDDAKENYTVRGDRPEDYYNSHRSRSPHRRSSRSREDDYCYDKNDRRRRRRRSFEMKDSRYYSSRDRDMSPDMRYDNNYRDSRPYSPERSSRPRDRSPARSRYEYDRLSDSGLGSTSQSLALPRQLSSTPSSPNLASADSPKRRMLPKTASNPKSLSNYQQNYSADDRSYNQNSSSRQHNRSNSDSKNPSTNSQRQSRDHKRHSKSSNGKGSSRSSRGKLVSQGSGSKQDQTPLGHVELQICYDMSACILYVTVIRAKGLYTLRDDGETCPDPFVKVYLLPGRSIENQRRTRHFTRTSNPEWNQTMVYPNLQQSDLKKRYLEVTAWNYDKNKPNEFLGEVVLDLSDPSVVDEDPKWYQLQEMVEPDGQQSAGGVRMVNKIE